MDQQKLKLFVEKLLAVDAKSLNEQQLAEHMQMIARAKAMMSEAPKPTVNFSIEDLKRLEQIKDLPTMKAQALGLISKPSAKPMKPEKVEWFKNALETMNSPMKVIKLMYDLMLSGEGNSVIGSRNSMNPNSYRQRFGEESVEESGEPSPVASAITRRIMMQRVDLLSRFGPQAVGQAIDDVADWVGDVEEIGSSDVSAWVNDVERQLNSSMAQNNPVQAEAYKRLDKILSDYKGKL